MISTPCKMFPRQISPRIFLKMSFFSLHVQNPFFRQTLMILKIDTRLGSEIKSLSTEGGTVNSCTALTPSRQWHHGQHYCIDQLCAISLFSARNLALFREVSSLLKTFCISLGKPRRKIQIQPFVYRPYPVGSPRSVIG